MRRGTGGTVLKEYKEYADDELRVFCLSFTGLAVALAGIIIGCMMLETNNSWSGPVAMGVFAFIGICIVFKG